MIFQSNLFFLQKQTIDITLELQALHQAQPISSYKVVITTLYKN